MLIRRWWTTTVTALSTLMLAALAMAQTSDPLGTTSTRTTETTQWYGQWYVWVGVAVFLVIVIALTNRPSRRT